MTPTCCNRWQQECAGRPEVTTVRMVSSSGTVYSGRAGRSSGANPVRGRLGRPHGTRSQPIRDFAPEAGPCSTDAFGDSP